MLILQIYVYGILVVLVVMLVVSLYETWRDRKDAPETWPVRKAVVHVVLCSVAIAVFWPLLVCLLISTGFEYMRPENVRLRRLDRAFQQRKSVY